MKLYLPVFVCLTFCAFIYFAFRIEATVLNQLILLFLSRESYLLYKTQAAALITVNSFAIFSLPEGLWVFCATALSAPFYIEFKARRINCIIIPLLFAISLEFMQLLHLTHGRFDWVDLVCSFAFWLSGYGVTSKLKGNTDLLSSVSHKSLACYAIYLLVLLSYVKR